MSKDSGPARDKPSYGSLWDSAGRPLALNIASTNQEHGLVPAGDPDFERLPIGSQVRIAPNHACMTAAAHERYHVVDGGAEVLEVWERCNGW